MKDIKNKKIFSKTAVTLVEVLVAITLTSVILLSMTKLVVVVLRNANENERYDIAIQEFSKAEEVFKSWYLIPDTNSNYMKSFCNLAANTYVDITKQFDSTNTSPTYSVPVINANGAKTVSFDGATKYLVTSTTLPENMWVSVQIEANNKTKSELKANSYVYWETNGKKFYFTNPIYIYTAERCPLI